MDKAGGGIRSDDQSAVGWQMFESDQLTVICEQANGGTRSDDKSAVDKKVAGLDQLIVSCGP